MADVQQACDVFSGTWGGGLVQLVDQAWVSQLTKLRVSSLMDLR